MPYYTKKGVGSDKDKVCVYKKSNKEKVGCTSGSINKYLAALYANENLKESEFSWIDDIKPEFNATMLRYGQKFKNKWGEYIRTIMFIGQDDEIISYEKPMTGLIFKIIDDPSGYKPYPSYPKDHPSNSELYLNPLDFDNGLKSGQFIPMFDDSEFKLKESNGDDMDWIRDIDADELDLNDIDFITDDQMFDVLEQQGFDVSGMSIGTMCELAMNIGYRWSDKHNGWYHRDEVEDFNYLDESTVGDLEWMKGPVQIRFGDIKNNISDYLAEGDKIYLSGFLYLSGGNNNLESPIILNNEPTIIKDFTSSESHPKVNVSFGENITSLPLWMNNMGGDYLDLGAFKSDDDILITVPQKNNINESEDLNWIENVPSNEIVKPWDGTIGSLTTPIYNRVYLYTDDDGVTREVKVGGLTSNYWTRNRKGEWFGSDGDIRFYDASISDEEIKAFNSDLEYPNPFEGKYGITMSRREYNDNASNGKIILTPNKVGINESEEDEFDWVRGVEIDLVPGEIYDIKTGNGYYWVPEKYVGKGWDEEHQMEFYKFEDIDGSTGSGRKSVPYVKDLMKKGHIRLYDPNWSIKDELTFSDNIEDALKGNFVIYFKDGVYLDQTLPIQDKLFEMGFSFYTKGPNEYITNKDSSDKIQFFESFNWDTSNPRYNKMPSDQWNKKKILLSSVKKDDGFRWRPKPNPRLDEQELFLTIMDHNAIVINGDKYVTNNINESDEFDWIQKQEPEKELKKSKRYVIDVSHLRPAPMRYSHDTSLTKQDILRKLDDLGYDVHHIDVDGAKYFYVEPTEGGSSWQYNEYGIPLEVDYWVDYNTDLMDDPSYGGEYQTIDVDEFMFLIDNNLISESEDFKWVDDIEPNKEYVLTDIRVGDKFDAFNDIITITNLETKDKLVYNNGQYVTYPYFRIEFKYRDGSIDATNSDIFLDLWNKNKIIKFIKEGFDDFDWVKEIPIGITKDIFIDLINSHPWFYITETDDGYLSVEVTDFFEDTIGNMVGVGVMSIDFDERQEHILNQIRKEFNWSYDLALNHQGPDKIKYLVIANDELAKILEPYVGKDNVKYYGGLVESKNFISESSGISLEVRDWSEIIYKEILESGSGERIIIDGYKYPKVFDVFPIDYIVIDFYDKLTGYDQDYSGYDSDGNYVVRLFIQPMVVNGNNKYSLLTVLNHEMKHAWQDYNRLSKGFSSIEHTKESKELYNKDFIIMLSNNNIKGPIKELLKYYYYVSNIEKEAYLENVYDGNVEYEKIVRDLISLDIESFKDRFDLDVNWFTINTNYNIPFLKKFKTPIEFIDYSSKHLKTRALDIIKKINKMKYVHKIK